MAVIPQTRVCHGLGSCTIPAAGFILLLLSSLSLHAALISAQAESYFRVDGLLADEMGPRDPEGDTVFRADIRKTPWIEPRRRIMPPPRSASSLGVGVSPRGRALESMKAADVFAESQDWRQALAAIQRGLDLEPDNILLIRRAAAYAAMARRFGVADEYFRKAIQVTPDDVPFLAGRAGILLRLLRLNEAEELAERALTLSPGYLAARFTLACVKVARGDSGWEDEGWDTIGTIEVIQLAEWMDADRADYTAALSGSGFAELCDRLIGPDTSEHLSHIALSLKQVQIMQRMRRWEEAISLLEEVQQLGAHSAGLILDIARSRFERGEREEAVHILTDLSQQYPELTVAQYDHAVALVRMDRFAEAQVVLEAAHEKDPASPQVIFGLACAHAAQGDINRAWRVLNRLDSEDRPLVREWTKGDERYIRAIREDPRFESFVGPAVAK